MSACWRAPAVGADAVSDGWFETGAEASARSRVGASSLAWARPEEGFRKLRRCRRDDSFIHVANLDPVHDSPAGADEKPRTYLVKTYGCQMNEHDSERISGMLEADGMTRVDDERDADVIVLNTCCIRENADNKLYGALGHLKGLKERHPGLQIAVGGCLAQKDREAIRDRAGHVDVVFGTHNVHRAVELLDHAAAHGPIVEILEASAREDAEAFPSALPTRREVDHAGWLTIQIGCDNSCAFCIVPAVRGPEISRPFGELLEEAAQLADDGVSEITLLGQNVNSYGRDLALARRAVPGADDPAQHRADDEWFCGDRWTASNDRRPRPLFGDLLRAVGAIDGVHRVRYTSPHPKDMRSETFAAMAETPEVCEHLHFPLQSGSDSVLAAMHRPMLDIYDGELLAVTDEVFDALPGLAGTSQRALVAIGNGHSAWEMALTNTLSKGDKVLVLDCGRFAAIWGEMISGNMADDLRLEFQAVESAEHGGELGLARRHRDEQAAEGLAGDGVYTAGEDVDVDADG